MSSDEEDMLGLLTVASLLAHHEGLEAQENRRRQRRWWVRPALQQRAAMGHADVLLQHLRSRDIEYYRDYLRMSPSCFDTLLEMLGPRIKKSDTNYRKAILAEHRLALAVRQGFLAAGETLRSSSFNFLSVRSTACVIVSEVCQAIWDILGPIYVALPSTQNEWSKVARDFQEKWDMPHCLGAIDGKHVNVECPANSGSRDRNYKGSFSKSVMAISDANYSVAPTAELSEIAERGSADLALFGVISRLKITQSWSESCRHLLCVRADAAGKPSDTASAPNFAGF
ncbi:hypothetical protein HPB52_002130 [Rhipicephalus sanguineus]|uniref:DDE Tnp4 domain-containing protein n=1 Tax=Rhipicephalus sanguineus TaxID=34632 RepID=A0A9D4PDC6_RHISA|nr:hypothetical protein HPB52_002130 [Rhipicephalus sanguineus]